VVASEKGRSEESGVKHGGEDRDRKQRAKGGLNSRVVCS
jgi:hypothetical protein